VSLGCFDCVNAVVMRAPPFDVVTVRRDELTRKGHVLTAMLMNPCLMSFSHLFFC
jgi:hypothetical protein